MTTLKLSISGLLFIKYYLLIASNLHICQAWLTASDGYNIGVTLGSALAGLILIVLLFFFLYYCWIKQLLYDYRRDHRAYQQEKGGVGSGTGGYYKKKPPPPDYGRFEPSQKQQEFGAKASPTRLESIRDSPHRSDDIEEGTGYRQSNGAGYHTGGEAYPSGTYRHSPNQELQYDRAATVRAVSPNRQIMTASALARQEFDSSLESRHHSPLPGGGRSTYTGAHYAATTGAVPGSRLEYDPSTRSVPLSIPASRPGSGLSTHSRAMDTALINYRADGGVGGGDGQQLRTSDSGTGASINYQATFQQKVTATSARNRAAYLGSAV